VWQWPISAFGDNAPTGLLKESNANGSKANTTPTLSATTPSIEFNLRYPGQYYDAESKLHYNYHRSYNAAQGRYTQPDPIGLDGGMNRFAYVNGNPVLLADPLGLDPQCGGGKRAVPTSQSGVYKCVDDGSDPNAKVCLTGECGASLLPAPIENRSVEQIECDLKDNQKKKLCKKVCKETLGLVMKVPGSASLTCTLICPKKYD
jgi:RHS repeat-associated protein